MIARSLRWRLLAGAAAAIFAALALAWVVMAFLFEAHVERSVEVGLTLHGRDLVAGLARDSAGALAVAAPPADPRFDRPASGYYWEVRAGGQALRSRSLWDQALPETRADARAWTASDQAGPFEPRLRVVARTVYVGDRTPILVMLGADHATVSAARDQFGRDLAIFLALLWAGLSAAAWLQVRLGLAPLDSVRAALAHMQGHAGARLREADYPTEAAPLAQAINALADARQRDTEQARRRAADLAHALKTPLAALAAQSRRAREAGAADAADGLDRAIEAAHGAVQRELARARIAAESEVASTLAGPVIDRVIAVVERTDAGARLLIDNDLGDAVLPASEGALMEIAGPLIENAVRFARRRVRISGGPALLVVEDDGPGLDADDAALVVERGRRLDESGDGLGLSIARDVAEACGAGLEITRSDLGGARVAVVWRARAPR